MVNRWTECKEPLRGLTRDANGQWVRVEDYDRLRAALERIIEAEQDRAPHAQTPSETIARAALAGTAETGEASRYDGHCRNCGASTKIDTGSHCPACYPPRASVPASEPRLPCDVRVGAVVFRAGVPVRTLQMKLDRDAALLRKLQPTPDPEAVAELRAAHQPGERHAE